MMLKFQFEISGDCWENCKRSYVTALLLCHTQ